MKLTNNKKMMIIESWTDARAERETRESEREATGTATTNKTRRGGGGTNPRNFLLID